MTAAQDALKGLQEAMSTPLAGNDLGRLAQMHSFCHALADAKGLPTNVNGALLSAVATSTALLLEKLILDEAKDPAAGMAALPQAVQGLQALLAGEAYAADTLFQTIATAIGQPLPAQLTSAAATAAAAPPQPVAQPQPARTPASSAPAEAPAANASAAALSSATAVQVEAYVQEPLTLDLTEREHLEGFLEEAVEHMDAIEAGLLEVEGSTSDVNRLNELFRPFHTIKGIAGFLNLRDINRLTHEIETILDNGRKGTLAVGAGTVDLIFGAVDFLKAQLAAIRQYMAAPTGGPCPQPDIVGIMDRLRRAALGQLDETDEPAAKKDSAATGGAPAVTNTAAETAESRAATETSIRVDTAKLDALVDAVGELVIAQSMVGLSAKIQEDDKLARNVSQVTKIVRDVQETAMNMRMVPIGHTFQKMRRLVRDVARKAGREVELAIDGEETELDKNVIQQISDPLVHLVRNAVDHGIEPPDVRAAAGKPRTGCVNLLAFHQGDSIVIEIRDDGAGLNQERIRAKAIERGIIGPDDVLTEQQTFGLVMQAGFSTAAQITDISGRGVGMDVVRRNVEQLRGKIEIESQSGAGSCFRIRLPLTLAIIDGMIVRVANERLIMPTILIEQALKPTRQMITSVQHRGQMVQVRGELCPLIQLGALFNYTAPLNPCESQVLIAQCETHKIGLVVEELIGQQQVVIKTLGDRFKGVRGVSGAAILGDGRVGLILEPSGLLGLHSEFGCPIYDFDAATPHDAWTTLAAGAEEAAAPDESDATQSLALASV